MNIPLSKSPLRILFSLSSLAAARVLLLLFEAPEHKLPTTIGVLHKLVGFSTRTVWRGIEELKRMELVSCHREGNALFIYLNNGFADDDQEECAEDAENNDETKPQYAPNQAEMFSKFAQSSQNPADCPYIDDEEEDNNISSSSSSISIPVNYAKNAGKRAEDPILRICKRKDEVSVIVLAALKELGIDRYFIFKRVREAAEGLPADMVKDIMERCIMRQPDSASYLVKALHNAHREIDEIKEKEEERLQSVMNELAVGEALLAGKSVPFNALYLSQNFPHLAKPLWDIDSRECILNEDYRDELQEIINGMRKQVYGGEQGNN